MNLRTVSPGTFEPIELADARLQCNVVAYSDDSPPTHPDDALITEFISTARQDVEEFCNVIMTDAVYEYRAPKFDGMLLLPRGPVSDVDWVKYLDENEALQTHDPSVYYFDDNPWAPVLGVKKNQAWPTTITGRDDTVRVQFTGGFYSPTFPVPGGLLQAMRMMIGHWYRNRESVAATQMFEVPLGAQTLMMRHRRGMGV